LFRIFSYLDTAVNVLEYCISPETYSVIVLALILSAKIAK